MTIDPQITASDLPQPLPLLVAYARRPERDWHIVCWTIDERMARIVLGAREGAAAAIRLAWWEEALTSDGKTVRGEPLLEQWHGFAPGEEKKAFIHALAASWRMLLDPSPMTEEEWKGFGQGRGALFPLIAPGGNVEDLTRAGALWALWDAARRDKDRERAEGAFAAAIARMEDLPDLRRSIACRPLALAAAMALDDVKDRQITDPGLTPRQYMRLLRRSLFW